MKLKKLQKNEITNSESNKKNIRNKHENQEENLINYKQVIRD